MGGASKRRKLRGCATRREVGWYGSFHCHTIGKERAGAQGVLDALADARTLVANAEPKPWSALGRAQDLGSRAVVACLDGRDLAAFYACGAAHEAFRAVRGLRG